MSLAFLFKSSGCRASPLSVPSHPVFPLRPPALRNEPRPSDLLHKPFFRRLVRSPGDRAEWKKLVLYSCPQKSSSFDSAQAEVSGGAGTLTFMAATPEAGGGTANVGPSRPQTDTDGPVAFLRPDDVSGNSPGEMVLGPDGLFRRTPLFDFIISLIIRWR